MSQISQEGKDQKIFQESQEKEKQILPLPNQTQGNIEENFAQLSLQPSTEDQKAEKNSQAKYQVTKNNSPEIRQSKSLQSQMVRPNTKSLTYKYQKPTASPIYEYFGDGNKYYKDDSSPKAINFIKKCSFEGSPGSEIKSNNQKTPNYTDFEFFNNSKNSPQKGGNNFLAQYQYQKMKMNMEDNNNFNILEQEDNEANDELDPNNFNNLNSNLNMNYNFHQQQQSLDNQSNSQVFNMKPGFDSIQPQKQRNNNENDFQMPSSQDDLFKFLKDNSMMNNQNSQTNDFDNPLLSSANTNDMTSAASMSGLSGMPNMSGLPGMGDDSKDLMAAFKKPNQDQYIYVKFGKRGWQCEKCLNFNFENRVKCNRCGLPMMPKLIKKTKGDGSGDEKSKKPLIERKGDWQCMKCKNLNFAFRLICNRCQSPKTETNAGMLKSSQNFNSQMPMQFNPTMNRMNYQNYPSNFAGNFGNVNIYNNYYSVNNQNHHGMMDKNNLMGLMGDMNQKGGQFPGFNKPGMAGNPRPGFDMSLKTPPYMQNPYFPQNPLDKNLRGDNK